MAHAMGRARAPLTAVLPCHAHTQSLSQDEMEMWRERADELRATQWASMETGVRAKINAVITSRGLPPLPAPSDEAIAARQKEREELGRLQAEERCVMWAAAGPTVAPSRPHESHPTPLQ